MNYFTRKKERKKVSLSSHLAVALVAFENFFLDNSASFLGVFFYTGQAINSKTESFQDPRLFRLCSVREQFFAEFEGEKEIKSFLPKCKNFFCSKLPLLSSWTKKIPQSIDFVYNCPINS